MIRVSPQLVADLIETFPAATRAAAEHDLAVLAVPPFRDIYCKLPSRALPAPVGLLEYALRFGSPASLELLLEAGADPNEGTPRLLTLLAMTNICADEGRIEKLQVLLAAGTRTDYVENALRVPPTPLIALARSKLAGIQRYWLARLLRSAGAPPIATNDYELHVITRLLAELRGIDDIMECLPPAVREATKAMPSSLDGLVAAVLRSEDPAALGRLVAAKRDVKLPLDFDATAELVKLTMQIADHPVSPERTAFVQALIAAGAVMQLPQGGASAFEHALGCENHELVGIFLAAGAKLELASSPSLALDLQRRKGRPQISRARVANAPSVTRQAVAAIDLLCSGIEGLEACADADLDRLTGDDAAALQSLVKRLLGLADRLAPPVPQNRPVSSGEAGFPDKPDAGTAGYAPRPLSVIAS
jgi:hypothetical protein